jgi:predicted DNA-binding antitoxin AbrB/MazE fold protein
MSTRFIAVYEGGLLRPKVPISLEEGAQVEVMIIQRSTSGDSRSPAEILAGIAALPTLGGDPFTSRDHDKVLYGER